MIYLLNIFCLFISCIFVNSADDPIVQLPNGQIKGKTAYTSRNHVKFWAFQGIPYAAPPVGKNRFQPPQPVENWEGILDASNSKICYQTGLEHANSGEDCLYLHVYTPLEPGNNASLPVMLNIHGGTFIRGTGYSGVIAPQFLMEHEVVIVSINYRLGPFGFLTTGDTVIPGNMGLKDQQYAIKWTRKNIHLFNGDPAKITIMGQSAGSASVTYQLLSSSSAGLFRAVIAQSGSALNTWAFQRHPIESAYGIAALIDPNFNKNSTSQELSDFLLSVDGKAIHATGTKFKVLLWTKKQTGDRGTLETTFLNQGPNILFKQNTTSMVSLDSETDVDFKKIFAPTIEVEHEGAFITESMYQAALNGRFIKVPYLGGICSEEGITEATNMNAWKKTVKTFDEDHRKLVDEDMYIDDNDVKLEVGDKIKLIYTNKTLLEDIGASMQYHGDNRYMRGPIKFAELISEYTNVYFYQFSYHGEMGANTHLIDGIGKVGHAEDLKYFWSSYKTLDSFPESDIRTMNRYVGLLTNFAKYLNPLPEKNELFKNLTFPEFKKDSFYYLDIDESLSIKENPREFSFQKWVDLFEDYARKPLISF